MSHVTLSISTYGINHVHRRFGDQIAILKKVRVIRARSALEDEGTRREGAQIRETLLVQSDRTDVGGEGGRIRIFTYLLYFSSLDRRERHRTSRHFAWKLRESIIPSSLTNMAMVRRESHGVAHVRSRRLPRDAGRRVDAWARDPVDPGPRSVHVAPIFRIADLAYTYWLSCVILTSHNEGNKHTACSTNDVRKQIVSSVFPFKMAFQAPSGRIYNMSKLIFNMTDLWWSKNQNIVCLPFFSIKVRSNFLPIKENYRKEVEEKEDK